jgi:hypothetical protein
VYVAFEFCWLDIQPKLFIEELNEAVNEVEGGLVAAVNERILTTDHSRPFALFVQASDVWIVFPQRRAGRSNICDKAAWV